jgi:hypothetical protein
MKEADVTEFKASLMRMRAEILGKSRQREDIWIVPSHEQIETVQLAGEREFGSSQSAPWSVRVRR